MIYPGCVGIHELMCLPGFTEWIERQTDDSLQLPVEQLIHLFNQEEENQ